MNKDKLQELLQTRAQADLELERLRQPVAILFSDIKGSTAYAEKKGDLEYMAMINRHNSILFPVIQAEGGVVVKTIGDAIMARFDDPVAAIKAGAGMQRALEEDRKGKVEIDQIRIKVGLHTGLGLIKEGDVFGDVVNAAARVQQLAEPDQVLITAVMFEAAKLAGFECAKMGRAELRGKDEPIDLYAVAWSASASEQLVTEVQARYEKKLKDIKRLHERTEEEFENARDQWRTERRKLNTEIERLEEATERARESARQYVSEELQSELRFQVAEAVRARQQAELDLALAQQKFETERNSLKAHIAGMQASVLESMERSNNPTRSAAAIREQVDARVALARQEWQSQWDGEHKRLLAEIDRLKRGAPGSEEKKEAARRALLQRLGKAPAGSGGHGAKTGEQWEREYKEATIQWSTERDHLHQRVQRLDKEIERVRENMRIEIFQEMRAQYEPKLAAANLERTRLEQEVQSLSTELGSERDRLNARVNQLEKALPEAQEAVRQQVMAELQTQFDTRLEEANRTRSRIERKFQDAADEWEVERRHAKKQIATLEEQLKQAKEAAYRAQRDGGKSSSTE